MNAFIEQNRGLLRTYCIGARIIGWALLIAAPIGTCMALSGKSAFTENVLGILYMLQALLLNFMLLGLVLLGVAQFIRYLFEADNEPGWILLHGTTVLYVAAVIVLFGCVVNFLFYTFFTYTMHSGRISLLPRFLSLSIPAAAKILILVGLGQILRRAMPIIEESKTLV
ncbi:MAG: hypothetical protein A2Z25_21450 [Planctomycetes bacterium RBG_16_55_9]|nr:MAG: hypothetical protein A2Z25_21450 [Planctomycetes bacterium RBG_16_55_9]